MAIHCKFLFVIIPLIFFIGIKTQAQPSFQIVDTTGSAGDKIDIPINVSGLTEEDSLISFQFNIEYDPENIYLINVDTKGTMISSGIIANPNYDTGKIRIAFASIYPVIGSGTLFYLQAELLANGTSLLIWDDARFFNGKGKDISTQLINGSINVSNPVSPKN